MNDALLRLARRRRNGERQWSVPGMPHAVTATPGRRSFFGTLAVHWPAREASGEWAVRGARVDWHRTVIKAEIRKLMESA